jgi:hypothetical protein
LLAMTNMKFIKAILYFIFNIAAEAFPFNHF